MKHIQILMILGLLYMYFFPGNNVSISIMTLHCYSYNYGIYLNFRLVDRIRVTVKKYIISYKRLATPAPYERKTKNK